MKRIFAAILAALFGAEASASLDLSVPAPEINVEISSGALYNKQSDLVLLGYTLPAPSLFGLKSYHQVNVGAWDGQLSASVVGIARGLQWDQEDGSFVRLSTGTSLISNTSYRLSTAFQFYEQLTFQKNMGNFTYGVSYRHWSNAFIKRPNYGMDFFGGHVEYRW